MRNAGTFLKDARYRRLITRHPKYAGVFRPGFAAPIVLDDPTKDTKAGKKACAHRGAETDRVLCSTCRGRVQLKVFACDKHGTCTEHKKVDGHTCCDGCPDHTERATRQARPKPPLIETRLVPQVIYGATLAPDDDAATLAATLKSIPPLPAPLADVIVRFPNAGAAIRLLTDEAMPTWTPGEWSGRGAVVCGGGKYFTSAYVVCRVLRHVGWAHPIQLWHLPGETLLPWQEKALEALDVEPVDAGDVAKRHPLRILAGWELKPFAVLHAPFEEVLYLDADSYPMRDPDYLFDLDGYQATGAIFTPDSGRFDLKDTQWRFFGVTPRHEWSFESGQFVVDKSRWWQALRLALHWCEWSDLTFRVIYGDKDTFHIAARKLGLDYAMSARRPGGGRWGLLQHDPNGDPLWVHRIHAKFVLPGDSKSFISAQQGSASNLPLANVCQRSLADLKAMRDGRPVNLPSPRLPGWLTASKDSLEAGSRAGAGATQIPAAEDGDAAILARSLGKYNLFLDPANNDMMPWIAKDGFWESWVTLALARTIKPGWHVIDGGAALGYYTTLFADAVGPGGYVIAAEPVPNLARLLARTLAANSAWNVGMIRRALWRETADDVPFLWSAGFGGSHITAGLAHPVPAPFTESRVGTTTIDELTAGWERCDLIKLDIEGGEFDALRGATRTLDRFPGCIVVAELLPGHATPEYIGFLRQRWKRCRYVTTDAELADIDWDALPELTGSGPMLWLAR